MGAGLGAAPAAMPAALGGGPAIGGGLGDLFDLGGGVGMPTGSYVPPKTVSIESINILRLQQSFISIFPALSQFVMDWTFGGVHTKRAVVINKRLTYSNRIQSTFFLILKK